MSEKKRKHIKEVASDVCVNLFKLIKDFLQDPIECSAIVELSSLVSVFYFNILEYLFCILRFELAIPQVASKTRVAQEKKKISSS